MNGAGVGHYCVNRRFRPADVGSNLELPLNIPTLNFFNAQLVSELSASTSF